MYQKTVQQILSRTILSLGLGWILLGLANIAAAQNASTKLGKTPENGLSKSNLSTNLVLDNLQFGPLQGEKVGVELDKVVAIVGNDIITRQEVRGKNVTERSQTLQQLILRKLLVQEAKKYHIQVSDTALNLQVDALQKTVPAKIRAEAGFRERVRDELLISNLQKSVTNRYVKMTNREINDYVETQLKKADDTLQLEDVLIILPKTEDESELRKAQELTETIVTRLQNESPKAVASDYKQVKYNALGWVEIKQIPASFARVLVNLPENQFSTPIVDRDGIHLLRVLARKQQTSDSAKSASVAIEEIKTAHILIKTTANAKQRIDVIANKIKAGEDFAELARYFSEDTGSAVRGGDLDWVTPGRMVPAFEKVMFATPVGKVSQPFQSPFGWHILKVYDRRQLELSNDDMLKQQARQALFVERAEDVWQLWLMQLRESAYVEILDKSFVADKSSGTTVNQKSAKTTGKTSAKTPRKISEKSKTGSVPAN